VTQNLATLSKKIIEPKLTSSRGAADDDDDDDDDKDFAWTGFRLKQ